MDEGKASRGHHTNIAIKPNMDRGYFKEQLHQQNDDDYADEYHEA